MTYLLGLFPRKYRSELICIFKKNRSAVVSLAMVNILIKKKALKNNSEVILIRKKNPFLKYRENY